MVLLPRHKCAGPPAGCISRAKHKQGKEVRLLVMISETVFTAGIFHGGVCVCVCVCVLSCLFFIQDIGFF